MQRSNVAVAFGVYLFVVAVAFAMLWAYDSTDDYAGWAPVTAVLSVPAVLVILRNPPQAGHKQVWTVAIPAGVALGSMTIFVVTLLIHAMTVKRGMLDLLGVVTFGGLALAIGFTTVVWRYLLRRPLRVGVANVIKLVALVGAGALLLAPMWKEFWLIGGLTLGWTVAPTIALFAEPRRTTTTTL